MNQFKFNSLKGAFVALMTIYSGIAYASSPNGEPLPPVKGQETISLMSLSTVSTSTALTTSSVSSISSLSSSTITIPTSRSTVTVTVEAEDGSIMDVLTYKAGASKQITIDTAGWDSGTYTVIVSNKSGVIYDTFIFVF
jgi:hypothetical protein